MPEKKEKRDPGTVFIGRPHKDDDGKIEPHRAYIERYVRAVNFVLAKQPTVVLQARGKACAAAVETAIAAMTQTCKLSGTLGLETVNTTNQEGAPSTVNAPAIRIELVLER